MLQEIHETEYTLTRDLELHFIELTKAGKAQNRLEQCISVFKDVDSEDEEMKVLFEKDPIFHKVNEEFKRCIQIDEIRERALAREMFQHDVASRLAYACSVGIAEGVEKGKVEIARAMKAKGFDNKAIAEITGFSEEELARI